MKDEIWILDFGSCVQMKRCRPIVLDSNALLSVAHGEEGLQDVGQLMRDWGKSRSSSVAFVADFIKLEAQNAERWQFKKRRVRQFLREVEKSAEGFYVEVRTPIRRVSADQRGQYMDLLPKSDRRILLKSYPQLSGTDICLLALSAYLRNSGFEVALASSDKELVEAAEALDVAAFERWPL